MPPPGWVRKIPNVTAVCRVRVKIPSNSQPSTGTGEVAEQCELDVIADIPCVAERSTISPPLIICRMVPVTRIGRQQCEIDRKANKNPGEARLGN